MYLPLSQAFMAGFDLAPGQLITDWESPTDVRDLLVAYQVKTDGEYCYGLHSKFRGDWTLIKNTAVNDQKWRSRYTFLRVASVVPNSDWIVSG